jgi:hypothetical protein
MGILHECNYHRERFVYVKCIQHFGEYHVVEYRVVYEYLDSPSDTGGSYPSSSPSSPSSSSSSAAAAATTSGRRCPRTASTGRVFSVWHDVYSVRLYRGV